MTTTLLRCLQSIFPGCLHSGKWTIEYDHQEINWNIDTKSIEGELLDRKDLVGSELQSEKIFTPLE
jgi:hypothetical protein